ncbi:MAG: sulfatase [bacterium]|nr:sulfatase [bacterium]
MSSIRRRDFLKYGAGALAGAALGNAPWPAGAAPATPPAVPIRPNLVFVMADQWRRQAIGAMGMDPVLTPNLDRFAGQGLLFEKAVAAIPICTPNRACLLTGRYPHSTGVTSNDIALPTNGVESISEVLAGQGYQTGYIGKWHLDGGELQNRFVPPGPRRQGFEFFLSNGCNHEHFGGKYWKGDDPTPILNTRWQPDFETDAALDYLRARDRSRPLALFVSWSPPHTGGGAHYTRDKGVGKGNHWTIYAAPDRFEALYRGKPLARRPNVEGDYAQQCLPGYFGACTSLDENFGRILKCLDDEGLAGDTLVVFTADHGEMMGSQGRMTKGIWFEESIGVPLIMRLPGLVKTGRSAVPASSIDLMPTILGLLGAPIPASVNGTDLSPVARGREGAADGERHLFLSFDKGLVTEADRFWRAVYTGRYTYVVADGAPSYRPITRDGLVLYDNEADPYQMHPIYRGQGQDALIDQLHGELETWIASLGDDFLEKRWAGGPAGQATKPPRARSQRA